jgi:hypothetical protein
MTQTASIGRNLAVDVRRAAGGSRELNGYGFREVQSRRQIPRADVGFPTLAAIGYASGVMTDAAKATARVGGAPARCSPHLSAGSRIGQRARWRSLRSST